MAHGLDLVKMLAERHENECEAWYPMLSLFCWKYGKYLRITRTEIDLRSIDGAQVLKSRPVHDLDVFELLAATNLPPRTTHVSKRFQSNAALLVAAFAVIK